jgi:hypothetical protein
MRRFVAIVTLVPLGVVLVMFAVANREIVAVSFDPFNSAEPAFALKMPLFVLIFVLAGLGVLIGGIAAWLGQHKWRVRARRAEAEARDLRARLEAQQREAGRLPGQAPVSLEAVPPFVVPPAA